MEEANKWRCEKIGEGFQPEEVQTDNGTDDDSEDDEVDRKVADMLVSGQQESSGQGECATRGI